MATRIIGAVLALGAVPPLEWQAMYHCSGLTAAFLLFLALGCIAAAVAMLAKV